MLPSVPKAPLGLGGSPAAIEFNLSVKPGAACRALIFASRKLSPADCDGITAFCGRPACSSISRLYKLLLVLSTATMNPI